MATNGQRARAAQVRVTQIGPIDGAIVGQRHRNVEATDLLALRVTHHVTDAPVITATARLVFRVVDHLVDEIAQVQHESQLIFRRGALVLEDHAPIGVLRALAHVLATDEGKPHRPVVIGRCSRARASDATAATTLVDEAIPVRASGLKPGHHHAAGMIRDRERPRAGACHQLLEIRRFGHFNGQRHRRNTRRRGNTRPQQYAVRCRISRRDTFRIYFGCFAPGTRPRRFELARPSNRCTHGGRRANELTPGQCLHHHDLQIGGPL
jgi:hypothetical protein